MKNPLIKSMTIAAVVIAGSYVAAPQLRANGRVADPVAAASDGASGVSATNLGQLERQIRSVEAEVAKTPTSSSLDFLARLYLSRGRITGDAATYAQAKATSEQSVAMAPRNPDARSILANVRYVNHDFAGALRLGRAIVAADPKQYDALAVVGDASNELGDYATAGKVFASLARLAPGSAAVTVRQARFAFLHGDVVAAKKLATTAQKQAETSGAFGSNLAFYSSFRAQLAFDSGDYRGSIQRYGDALAAAPGDRVASFGLGRALAATKKYDDAIRVLTSLTSRYPDPAAFALLGDVLTVRGRTADANNAYAVVEATAALAQTNRQIYDRQLSLFYANHHRRLDEALRLARGEASVRKDVYAYDTLAWAELKSGHVTEASAAISKAFELGTPDANLYFHAGMIALAAHDTKGAAAKLRRALDISPEFDPIHAPAARVALASLHVG